MKLQSMTNADLVVVLLDDEAALDPAFGGKAVTLARMRQAGVNVPGGVALSSEVFLDELSKVLDGRDPGDSIDSPEVLGLIAAMELRVPVLTRIRQLVAELGMDPAHLVVRSSAVGEDSDANSFAGQLESVIDVGLEDVPEAVAAVWRSAWSPRALHYRRRVGLTDIPSLPVGVVIQALVEPERAGVMFTVSTSGSGGDALIESVPGRGGQLVDGSRTPTRYERRAGRFIAEGPADGLLPDEALDELAATGRKLEALLGVAGLDIEWVYANGTVSIVQARPVTTTETLVVADPLAFACIAVLISHERRAAIPDALATKDKFRLRLLASQRSVPISRGWLVSCAKGAGGTIDDVAGMIESQAVGEDQVSIVLQRPARFQGEILRQFSSLENLRTHLSTVVGTVGGVEDEFDFIVTEVYKAEQSGISHLSAGRLYVEVGFGAYIPKGVVPTSLYVFSETGEQLDVSSVLQETGIFIEAGTPIERPVGRRAVIDGQQAADIRAMTQAVVDDYGDVSVEFGVRPSGECYLIDIIPEGAGAMGADIRVMSPGRAEGTVVIADSEDLLARSLEAHFHSERSGGGSSGQKRIIVAPRPFLALEEYLQTEGDGDLGFIFESGSLLGHLAIILREHRVPAIVIPSIRDQVREGDVVRIDTSTEGLLERA